MRLPHHHHDVQRRGGGRLTRKVVLLLATMWGLASAQFGGDFGKREDPRGAQLKREVAKFATRILDTAVTTLVMRRILNARTSRGLDWEEPHKRRTNASSLDAVVGCATAKTLVSDAVASACGSTRADAVRMGARPIRGILLTGDPGTGKSMLARAVARDAELPLIVLSGADFNGPIAGLGVQRVKATFAEARRKARRTAKGSVVVFIDEVDALGRKRGGYESGGGVVRDSEATLNQLLVEMDNSQAAADGVLVIAATNRVQVLDLALTRKGRFDLTVKLVAPDRRGRERLFESYLASVKTDFDVSSITGDLASATAGFVGSDVAALVSDAARRAVLSKAKTVSRSHVDAALDAATLGAPLAPNDRPRLSRDDKWRTAVHEAGHAVAAWALLSTAGDEDDEDEDPAVVQRATIVPRADGSFAGAVAVATWREHSFRTRSDRVAELSCLLAGRAAEMDLLREPTDGAASDVERATRLAQELVRATGLSPLFGPFAPGGSELGGGGHGGATTQNDAADAEALTIVRTADDAARRLVYRHRNRVRRLATALVAYETLDSRQIQAILGPAPNTKKNMPLHHLVVSVLRRPFSSPLNTLDHTPPTTRLLIQKGWFSSSLAPMRHAS